MNGKPRVVVVETHKIEWAPLRVRPPTCGAQPIPPHVRIGCTGASFLLHMLAAFALLGVTPMERLPPVRSSAGVTTPGNGDSIEPLTVVFLDEVTDAENVWPEPPALAAIHLPGLIDLSVPDLDLPRIELGELETASDTARSNEPVPMQGTDRLELYERYLSQIKARIERAREQVDSPANTVSARCLAFVRQDTSGAVLDVQLPNCTADPAWRASLVTAIRRASPLPAPPVAQIFAERVSIEFGNAF